MPTNLLPLPLPGGYWFLHAFHYTRFRSQRLDGYRLLVESALVGVVLTFVSRFLVVGVNVLSGVRFYWFALAPQDIPFLGTAAAPHDTYLSITALYSGYRSKETLELTFTVDYLTVFRKHEELNPDDFRVVVPLASIRMASFFDETVYPEFRLESDAAARTAG